MNGSREEPKIDLKALAIDSLRNMWRRIAELLALASLVGGIVFAVSSRNDVPLYEAKATFSVAPTESVTTGEAETNYAVLRRIAKSFPYVAASDAMRMEIMERTGVDFSTKRLKTESLADVNAFSVSVLDENPETAREILETIIDESGKIGEKVIGKTDVWVLDEPKTSPRPVNEDDARRNAGIAMLVVLALEFVAVVAFSFGRRSIRTERDMRRELNVRVLASVPKVRKPSGCDLAIDDRRTPFAVKERTKRIRIRIEGIAAETGARTFLVSSSIADEGKSLVATNLALSLAEHGRSVVLADLDFRNPTTAKILKVKGGKGTRKTSELRIPNGKNPLDAFTTRDEKSGVRLFAPKAGSSSEAKRFLSGDVLPAIMRTLRDSVEFVVVDAPPAAVLSDAAEMARLADYGIYVVRRDYAPLETIEEGLDVLTDAGLKIMGCALNFAEGEPRRTRIENDQKTGNE